MNYRNQFSKGTYFGTKAKEAPTGELGNCIEAQKDVGKQTSISGKEEDDGYDSF